MSNIKVAGMTTCKICGRDFPLIAERRYTARDAVKSGIAVAFNGVEEALYDAIDCPHCGCQNTLQARKRADEFTEMAGMAEKECDQCCGCCEEADD